MTDRPSSPALLSRLGCVATVLAAGIAFVAPMWSGGSLPPGDDLPFALQLAHTVAEGWAAGTPWPRWVDAMNAGLGGPALAVYPPVGAWTSGALLFVLGDPVTAMRATALLGAWAAGFAFFVALRPFAGRLNTTLGAVLYVALPYHFVDQYPRFALAETLAFACVPLVYRFAAQTLTARGRERARAVVWLAAASGALLLTHTPTAALVATSMPVFLGLVIWRSPSSRTWTTAASLLVAAGLALGLAAFQLAPAWSERAHIRTEGLVQVDHGALDRNFLFRDEAAFGFSPSRIKPSVEAAFLPTLTLTLASAAMLAWRRDPRRDTHTHTQPAGPSAAPTGAAMTATAALAALLQLPWSEPLWHVCPGAAAIQFPWRFGIVLSASAAWLVTLALETLRRAPELDERDPSSERRIATRIAAQRAALALVSAWAVLVGLQIAFVRPMPEQRDWLEDPSLRGRIVPEYLPASVKPASVIAFARAPHDAVETTSEALVDVEVWSPGRRVVHTDSPIATQLTLATFAHPRWSARIDGRRVVPEATGPLQRLRVPVEAGRHRVEWIFESGALDAFGAGTSALAVLACMGLLAYARG